MNKHPEELAVAHHGVRGAQEIRYRPNAMRVLLLQGPVGPFFRELTQDLLASGIEITQISFNQGDSHYANSRVCIPVNCRIEDFHETFVLHLSSGIDAVVLFGSERPAHQIARNICKTRGIPVLSLEEGYIRPGAVTIEDGGNNASSPLTSLSISDLHLGRGTRMAAANYRGYWPMVWHGLRYYLLRQMLSGEKEQSFNHRETPLSSEAYFWARNVVRKVCQGRSHHKQSVRFTQEHPGKYFVVPLQVPSDSNIKQSANGWTTQRFIHETLASFARNAPADNHLVYKIHPMARGHSVDHKLIRKLAETHRISSRVHILHSGLLGPLTSHSAGMLTINSTSGLSAIHHGVPLLTVGKSIYAHSELATLAHSAEDIDQFWRKNKIPPEDVRRAFLAHIRREALIPGDFYARRGRLRAVVNTRKRIIKTIFDHRTRKNV